MDIRSMNREQKAGQLVMAEAGAFESEAGIMRCVQEDIGNFFIPPVVTMSRDQLCKFTQNLQEMATARTHGIPPFIASPNEGGMNSALGPDSILFPGALNLSSGCTDKTIRHFARAMGEELANSGFNLVLNPVCNISPFAEHPNARRTPGDSPDRAAAYVAAVIKGLQSGGMGSAAGFFPFLGPDISGRFPGNEETRLVEAWTRPFQAAIRAGAKAIVVAPVSFVSVDRSGTLSVFSRTILEDFLRNRLGFRALIIADLRSLGEKGRDEKIQDSAVKAILAGADMIIPPGGNSGSILAKKAIALAIQSGKIPEADLDLKLGLVLKAKAAFKKKEGKAGPHEAAKRERKRAQTVKAVKKAGIAGICRFKDDGVLPLPQKDILFIVTEQEHDTPPPSRLFQAEAEALIRVRYPKARIEFIPFKPDEEDIRKAGKLAFELPACVIFSNNLNLHPEQLELVRACAERNPNTTVCAMGSPLDALAESKAACVLLAWEYTPLAAGSLLEVLSGNAEPEGWCPLSVVRKKAVNPVERDYFRIVAKYPPIW